MRGRLAWRTAAPARAMSPLDGPGEPRHGGARHAPGDLRHGLEVALGGDGEAGLDDVDAHLVEQAGDLDLVLEGHGGAGALLAVAQRRVEDQDAVGLGRNLGHGGILDGVRGAREVGDGMGDQARSPERPGPKPGRPSGAAKEKQDERKGGSAARTVGVGSACERKPPRRSSIDPGPAPRGSPWRLDRPRGREDQAAIVAPAGSAPLRREPVATKKPGRGPGLSGRSVEPARLPIRRLPRRRPLRHPPRHRPRLPPWTGAGSSGAASRSAWRPRNP